MRRARRSASRTPRAAARSSAVRAGPAGRRPTRASPRSTCARSASASPAREGVRGPCPAARRRALPIATRRTSSAGNPIARSVSIDGPPSARRRTAAKVPAPRAGEYIPRMRRTRRGYGSLEARASPDPSQSMFRGPSSPGRSCAELCRPPSQVPLRTPSQDRSSVCHLLLDRTLRFVDLARHCIPGAWLHVLLLV